MSSNIVRTRSKKHLLCSKVKCQKATCGILHKAWSSQMSHQSTSTAVLRHKIVNVIYFLDLSSGTSHTQSPNQPPGITKRPSFYLWRLKVESQQVLLKGLCACARQANKLSSFMVSCSKWLRVLFLWALTHILVTSPWSIPTHLNLLGQERLDVEIYEVRDDCLSQLPNEYCTSSSWV